MAKRSKSSGRSAGGGTTAGTTVTWQAGQTPLSMLTPDEQQSRLGLRVTDAELRAAEQAIRAAEALRAVQPLTFAAPVAVDWRNNNGDWTTPIKDQQSCGSCVSFATCATIEARVKIACKNASLAPDLSEAHLFYCGCPNCCPTGWNFAPALDFCKQTGVAREADFPYTPGNQPCKSGLNPYVTITAWNAVMAVADRKNILAAKGPMVAGMAVYSDFYSYRSGVYRHTSGNLVGYHAVSVVGYDDNQRCWICKNSWGPGWGESGWFRIGYGEAGIDTQFAFHDVDAPCPAPGPTPDACGQYAAVLARVLRSARGNPPLRACLRRHICSNASITRCTLAHLTVVRGVSAILKRCPHYKVSFCRALGQVS